LDEGEGREKEGKKEKESRGREDSGVRAGWGMGDE
jgi:hypothetical protein